MPAKTGGTRVSKQIAELLAIKKQNRECQCRPDPGLLMPDMAIGGGALNSRHTDRCASASAGPPPEKH
jgi:hypothetical protein